MASSSEAFAKFSKWKNFKMPVKVTVIEEGKAADVWLGVIGPIDEDASQVMLYIGREHITFDFDESAFEITEGKISASRGNADWIVFEESE